MSDRVAQLSEELARDPASLAFVPLAEALRRDGRLSAALHVAERGAARHPQATDAHDVLARVLADMQDLAGARHVWHTVLACDPAHTGAMKGLGYLAYREGNWFEAERWFGSAGRQAPGDPAVQVALERVRAARGAEKGHASGLPNEAPPNGDGHDVPPPFMIDADGLVLAGNFGDDGAEAESETAGVELAAVVAEARRALTHLKLGDWESLVVETETSTIAVAAAGSALVVLTSPHEEQAGLVRARLSRATDRGRRWLESLR